MKQKTRKELETILSDGLSWCMKCGACLATCPVYRNRRSESASMRGKLALLQAIEKGRNLPRDSVSEALSTCTGCQSCSSICPNGVDTVFLTLVARLLFAGKGTHDWTDRAGVSLRKFKTTSRLTLAARPILVPASGQIASGKVSGELPGRVINALREDKDFSSVPVGSELLFPGCALSKDSDRLNKLERINHRLDLGLILVPDFGCCGMPELGLAAGLAHAEQISNLFAHFSRIQPKRVYVACHRCLTGFRYMKLLYNWSPNELEIFDRIFDLTGLLAEKQWVAQRRVAGTITVHDSCHLKRFPGAKAATRTILSRILADPLVESPGEGTCCGFGGSFLFRQPALSGDLRRERVEQLKKSRAKLVATTCLYCADFLELPLKRQGIGTTLLIDLIDQAV